MSPVQTLPELEKQVLRTLLYFDIFNYPLKPEEVYRFLQSNTVTQEHVEASLANLIEQKIIFRSGQLYCLRNEPRIFERRKLGNENASKLLPLAMRRASLISRFPFVRAVFASGSFSKDYMDENSDLDFFIVTAPGRLWIPRTLLVLYKRIAFLNSHKFFCLNYFVDEHHLAIEEANLFTATELATLVPLYNPATYRALVNANPWVRKFFPNFRQRDTSHLANAVPGTAKRIIEQVLEPFAPPLEVFFRWITLVRFRRLYQNNYSITDFNIAFKTSPHTSKNHPKNYQKKVMNLYHEKLSHHDLPAA